jgi:putative tricarboxylic transport membrane protein
MYIGNVMLVLLNLPLIGIWVQMLKVPYSLLYVFIVLLCQIGAFSVNNDVNDVFLINIFGLVGYLMKRYGFEGAPLILALVLGPMLESSLRRSLMMSDGNPAIFLTRPISAVFLVVALIFLVSPLLTRKRIGEKAVESKD